MPRCPTGGRSDHSPIDAESAAYIGRLLPASALGRQLFCLFLGLRSPGVSQLSEVLRFDIDMRKPQ